MFWQTHESASYAYLTNVHTKDRILPIFVLRRELKEVLGTMMLNSSSSDEEDIDFVLLELACRPKTCLGTRLNMKDVYFGLRATFQAAGTVENGRKCRWS